MTRKMLSSLALIALLAVPLEVRGAELRHGKRFDPGTTMIQRAPGAPEELDRLAGYRGQWDVSYKVIADDGGEKTAGCLAAVTYVNRGHGFSELLHCPAGSELGHELDTLTFVVFNPGTGLWVRGEVDAYREMIAMAQGGFEGNALVLADARRRGGGVRLFHERHSYRGFGSGDRLEIVTEESSDGGATWKRTLVKSYTRRLPTEEFLAPGSEFGEPSPERAAETAEFDFLIGRWNSTHDLTMPTGQQARWQSNSTAVHVLNGRAIMEFDWYDVDPSLPDAATTIVRLYNRAMRRWESLYVPNRGHGMLHFGGKREGDTIVLHLFGTGGPAASRFVFYNVAENSYDWYSDQSTDYGATATKNWVIRVERAPEEERTATASAESSSDR